MPERVPPHNLQAEESLLGAMLLSKKAIEAVASTVRGVDFYKPAHAHIFEAVVTLHGQGDPVEPVSVADLLERTGLLDAIGGASVLISLQANTPATSSAPKYATIVSEMATLRRLIAAAGEVAERAYALPYDVAEAAAAATRLFEREAEQASSAAFNFASGGAWVLDRPDGVPAVWGQGDHVLWAKGESLLIVGPPGVGKTTLVQQVVLARTGIRPGVVLELPVLRDDAKVLYLACDRPQQIARSFGRGLHPIDREHLDERLIVWQGPPPRDFAKAPELLRDMARAAGAGTVIVDSLKDVAIGLNDDEVGSSVNRAVQTALADGIEVCVLHHQRKSQGGTKPTKLEDVYGSTWITAGCGSVVLLWGQAGDPIVRLEHLKQPAGEVGPLEVFHDHVTARSTVERGTVDPLKVLRGMPGGLTAKDLARLTKGGGEPTENEAKKAKRQLDRLVRDGLAKCDKAGPGGPGGAEPDNYVALSLHEPEPDEDF